jgi:ABC-2 type transport system permease protein
MPTSPEPRTTSEPHPGVIHDIGYRHYDGPRLGRGYVWRSLAGETLRGAYGLGRSGRAKVAPLLLLAALCVPAFVASAIAAITLAREPLIGYPAYAVELQVLVSVFVAAQAPATVSRDLRFGVVPLYLSRPLQRVDYVSARYAAFAAAVLGLLAVPLTVLLVGSLLAEMPLGEQLPDYLRALAAAAVLALVLAGLGLGIAAVTPRRGLGVAAIITVLLVLSGVQGATQAIALEQGARTLAGYSGLLSPYTLVDGVSRRLLGSESAVLVGPPGTVGGLIFLLVTGLVVAACCAGLVLRYRRVSIW